MVASSVLVVTLFEVVTENVKSSVVPFVTSVEFCVRVAVAVDINTVDPLLLIDSVVVSISVVAVGVVSSKVVLWVNTAALVAAGDVSSVFSVVRLKIVVAVIPAIFSNLGETCQLPSIVSCKS